MSAAVPDDAANTAAEPLSPPQSHLTVVPDQPGTEIAIRPRASLNERLTYAHELAKSGLLPASYRRQPSNVLYAMEYASMLNLSPMAALTGIHVIDGKPTASAALMSALVRREGHKLRVKFDKATMTAKATLIRADDPDEPFEVEWDLQRAVDAGLCTIKDGKAYSRDSKGRAQPWEKYTPNMLKWRAVSEACRDGAEECLMGMHYTPEELGAAVDGEGNIIDGEIVEDAPDVDWDAEIAKVVDDRNALAALWKRAPRDSEARTRIAAAATAAAARAKAAKEEASAGPVPDADGVVDAEIVDNPNDPTELARSAARFFDALMACETREQVDNISRDQIVGNPVGTVDISGLLTEDARETLGVREGAYSLGALAHVLRTYTERHQRAAGAPVDADQAGASS